MFHYICISGPVIGSGLYNLGGFLLPFVTVGSIGVILAICLFFAIPSGEYKKKEECSKIKKKKLTWSGVIEVYHKINHFCTIKKTLFVTIYIYIPLIYVNFI